jgi:hypothetical protein
MDALHEYDDGLLLMKEAYALDPKVKGLDVVMNREINKLEMSVLSPALNSKNGFKNYYYSYSNYYYNYRREETAESLKERQQKERDLANLISFGGQIYAEGKTDNPAFWPLSVAYLYFIQQDWKNCEAWIAKATRQSEGHASYRTAFTDYQQKSKTGRCNRSKYIAFLTMAGTKGKKR